MAFFYAALVLFLKFSRNYITSLRQNLVIYPMKMSVSTIQLLRGLSKTVYCRYLMQC